MLAARLRAYLVSRIPRGMKKLGDEAFVWSEENIDKLIANPKAMLPDSPMSQLFTGIPNAQERADIIAYLKTVPVQ